MAASRDQGKIKSRTRRVDRPTYAVEGEIARFNPRNNQFNRKEWDSEIAESHRDAMVNFQKKLKDDDGFFSYAAWSGAWYVAHINNGGESNDGGRGNLTGLYQWEGWDNGLRKSLEKRNCLDFPYTPTDLRAFTERIRELAVYFGASAAGICRLNRDWLFSHDYYAESDVTKPLEVPKSIEYAVVMLFEMRREPLMATPEFPASIETGFAYSRMSFTAATMGQAIRSLGYQALPAGNDTALSVPLAIDAGLGQLGRNGLLVHPEFGSRVRIAKVLTDMPLEPDQPIDFGLEEACNKCKKCATECEVDAISPEEMTTAGPNISNCNGARKWYLDAEKCYRYWAENGLDCSTCITVCPYS